MAQEVLEQVLPSQEVENCSPTLNAHAKLIYTKDFLLSLSQLEECKVTPEGVDPMLLRKTESSPVVEGNETSPTSNKSGFHGNKESDAPPQSPSFDKSLHHSPLKLFSGSCLSGQGSASNSPVRGKDLRSPHCRWAEKKRENHQQPSPRETVHDGLLGSGCSIIQAGLLQTYSHDQQQTPIWIKMSNVNVEIRSNETVKKDNNFVGDTNGIRATHEHDNRDLYEQHMQKGQKKKLKETWKQKGKSEAIVSPPVGNGECSSSKNETLKSEPSPQKLVQSKRNNSTTKGHHGEKGDKPSQTQSPLKANHMCWIPTQGGSKGIERAADKTRQERVPKESKGSGLSDQLNPNAAAFTFSSLMPAKSQGPILPMPVGPSLQDVESIMIAKAEGSVSLNEQSPNGSKGKDNSETIEHSEGNNVHKESPSSEKVIVRSKPPLILTCEDIEQSLLATSADTCDSNCFTSEEVQEEAPQNINLIRMLHPDSDSSPEGTPVFQKTAGNGIRETASLQLISMLHKRTEEEMKALSEMHQNSDGPEGISLESLFGKVFVNELLAEAEPVSSKVTSNGDQANDVEEVKKSSETDTEESQAPQVQISGVAVKGPCYPNDLRPRCVGMWPPYIPFYPMHWAFVPPVGYVPGQYGGNIIGRPPPPLCRLSAFPPHPKLEPVGLDVVYRMPVPGFSVGINHPVGGWFFGNQHYPVRVVPPRLRGLQGGAKQNRKRNGVTQG